MGESPCWGIFLLGGVEYIYFFLCVWAVGIFWGEGGWAGFEGGLWGWEGYVDGMDGFGLQDGMEGRGVGLLGC